jgi:SSS family solute:Na+ symporter
MSPRGHIWALRLAVVFVAFWAFCFSLLWTQTQYIALWWALTGGVFTGGAGAAIIGGLYWKRGTTAGAWAGAITGSTLSFIGVLCSGYWPKIKPLLESTATRFDITLPQKFWLNGLQVAFAAACVAVAVYVIVSLLTSREKFNLDKLLHRGKYAVEGTPKPPTLTLWERLRVRNILQFSSDFTKSDKMVSAGIFWWSMLLLAINVIISAWNMFFWDWPVTWWSHYWMVTAIAFPFIIALATLVWFTIGGFIDMKHFFHALRTMQRDARDDGRVEGESAVELPVRSVPSDAVSTKPPAAEVLK